MYASGWPQGHTLQTHKHTPSHAHIHTHTSVATQTRCTDTQTHTESRTHIHTHTRVEPGSFQEPFSKTMPLFLISSDCLSSLPLHHFVPLPPPNANDRVNGDDRVNDSGSVSSRWNPLVNLIRIPRREWWAGSVTRPSTGRGPPNHCNDLIKV